MCQNQQEWRNCMIQLSQNHTLCTFDYQGIQNTDTPIEDITLLDTATKAFDVLVDLKWNKFYIMGHSFGGLVGLQLALLLRGRDDLECQGIILLAAAATLNRHGPLVSLIQNTIKETGFNVNGMDKQKCIESIDWNAFTMEWLKGCIVSSNSISPTNFTRNLDLLQQQMEICLDATDILEQLHLISHLPCLFIQGEKDPNINLLYSSALSENMINAQTCIIPGASHWMWMNDRKRFCLEIVNFIQKTGQSHLVNLSKL